MRELEARLAALEARLATAEEAAQRARAVLGNSRYGIVQLRRNNTGGWMIVSMNAAAARLEGVRAEEAVGRELAAACPKAREAKLESVFERAAQTRSPQRHQTRLFRDGQLVHCHDDYIFPFDRAASHGGEPDLLVMYHDSTERAQMEEELRRSAMAIEQSIDGIAMVGLDARFQFANPAFARMHGHTPEALLGRSLEVCFSDAQWREQVRRGLDIALRTGQFLDELDHQRADGSEFPARVSISAIVGEDALPGALLLIARDISRTRAVEQRLRLLRTAVDEATDGVMITDAQLGGGGPRVRFVNEAFTKLTGYAQDDIAGKSPMFLRGPKTDPQQVGALAKALRNDEPWEGRAVNYRKDGSEIVFEWRVAPVHDNEGAVTHFVALLHDVTMEERATHERRRSERLGAIAHTAVTLNHEINTPLQSISGYASLLLADEPDPEKREALEEITAAAERIRHVVRRVDKLRDARYTKYLGEQMMLDLDAGGDGTPGEHI